MCLTLIAATGLVYQVGRRITDDRTWGTRLQPLAGRISLCYLSEHLPVS